MLPLSAKILFYPCKHSTDPHIIITMPTIAALQTQVNIALKAPLDTAPFVLHHLVFFLGSYAVNIVPNVLPVLTV